MPEDRAMDTTPNAPALLPRPARRHRRGESGQGLVEYAFILVLVAMTVLIALQVLGRTTGDVLYSNISSGLTHAGG